MRRCISPLNVHLEIVQLALALAALALTWRLYLPWKARAIRTSLHFHHHKTLSWWRSGTFSYKSATIVPCHGGKPDALKQDRHLAPPSLDIQIVIGGVEKSLTVEQVYPRPECGILSLRLSVLPLIVVLVHLMPPWNDSEKQSPSVSISV